MLEERDYKFVLQYKIGQQHSENQSSEDTSVPSGRSPSAFCRGDQGDAKLLLGQQITQTSSLQQSMKNGGGPWSYTAAT